MKKLSKRMRVIIILVMILILTPLGILYSRSRFNIFPQLTESYSSKHEAIDFPEIKQKDLSISQKKVVEILREEYKLQPSGTKYSEGVNEPWCADFVSWVFHEADASLSNPNNDHWRIPGTYTLREYYEQANRFKSARSVYSPKVGDIMLYDNPSPFGQHTNIVIDNTNEIVTTIGGNEPGGIRIVKHTKQDDAGFIGYGVF